MRERLIELQNIDWRRNAVHWKLRCIRNDGKILTSNRAIKLTAIRIKKEIGLDLAEEEVSIEKQLFNSINI